MPLPVPSGNRQPIPQPTSASGVRPVAQTAPQQPSDLEPSNTGTTRTTTTAVTQPLLGGPLRRLYQDAASQYAAMDSYIVRLTRRECVNGRDKPEEVMLFKFRKQPWSLHFRWLEGDGKGREVIYVKGRYENKIHTLLAAGDMPLTPAGKRIALPVDSMLVRNASRHAITEAGIGANIDRFGTLLDASERGDVRGGTLRDVGAQSRGEFSLPAHAVEHAIPPGAEPELPRGGKRFYWFDPETKLPMLVQTYDDRGKEVEYYFYSRLMPSVHLDDQDFDPDRQWIPVASGRRPAR